MTKLVWPCIGRITQVWGENVANYTKFGMTHGHNGLDIAAPLGTPVHSILDGVVVWCDFDAGGYGNYVRVYHEKYAIQTFYAHLQKILVEPNQRVSALDRIGLMGSTGNSSGSHLHLEVRLAISPSVYQLVANGQKKGRVDPITALEIFNRVDLEHLEVPQ